MINARDLLDRLVRRVNPFQSPEPVQRPPQEQARIDMACRSLTFYQFRACPYCLRVRRVIAQLGLTITALDVRQDGDARRDLITGGGLYQVPCLRIAGENGEHWLYESEEIIAYLQRRFAPANSDVAA